MKIVKITCVLCGLVLISPAVIAQRLSTASALGVGGAAMALGNTEAVLANPAAIDANDDDGFIAASSMPFAIPELLYSAVGTSLKAGPDQRVYTAISNVGISSYRKTRITLGYSRKLFKSLQVALDLSAGMEYFEGYKSQLHVGYGIGLFCRISNELSLGMYVTDVIPVPAGIPPLPSFSFGVCFSPSGKSRICADLVAVMERQASLCFGVEHDISHALTLRCGVSTNPAKLHFGASVNCSKSLSIAMSMSYHLILGVSPALDITFTFR